ncbi:asparagine synthase-related protein, partial [Prochlorococcus marinus]
GGVSSQKERELHNIIDYIFQNKLKNAIPQGENRIGCELSSGLDSNAIVGGLIKGLDIDPRNIFTWSHDGNGEESYIKEFQTFHKLNTENTHINKTEYKKENFQESLKENLFIFGMPHQLGGNTECIKFFKKCSCKILFSGFGGDQAISHNGHNLATDLIKNFEFIEFFQWMDNPLKALKTMLGRTYGLINNDWQESKFSKKVSHMKKNNLLISLLTEKGKDWLIPHLSKEFIAEIDTYSTLHNSIRQRCMSQWVSVRLEEEVRLAAKYGIRKYFPLLDETLLGTLLNQDPKYFAEKYLQGRLIHRKSFAKYLPEKLRLDPSKYRDINNQWTAFEREKQAKVLNDLIEFSQQWNQHLSKFWQLDELKKYAINTQINIKKINIHESSKVIKAMRTVNKLSCWFSELE